MFVPFFVRRYQLADYFRSFFLLREGQRKLPFTSLDWVSRIFRHVCHAMSNLRISFANVCERSRRTLPGVFAQKVLVVSMVTQHFLTCRICSRWRVVLHLSLPLQELTNSKFVAPLCSSQHRRTWSLPFVFHHLRHITEHFTCGVRLSLSLLLAPIVGYCGRRN